MAGRAISHAATVGEAPVLQSRPLLEFCRRILTSWQGLTGALILFIVIAAAILSPWITPYPMDRIDYMAIMQAPDDAHLFGTDEVGRDVLSRVIAGSRTSLAVAVAAVGLSLVCGCAIGLMAAWIGGWVEKLLMRLMDALLAFPLIVLALSIIAILGPSLQNAVIAIGTVKIPHFARLMRSEVLVVKELEYVRAARTLGASTPRILIRHVLPNSFGPALVYISIAASHALMTEASLSFLGLGVQPPTPSWGGMVSVGMQNFQFWWMSFWPGLAIFVTVLGFNLLGDAIRDAMDARLR